MDSADSWIINYVEKAPAFVAANAGYDVWLGNLRGNKYNLSHDWFDPIIDAKEFWDFSIVDHTEDLVTMIDYIRKVKKGKRKGLS